MELTFFDLFRAITKRWYMLVITTVLFTIIGAIICTCFIQKEYTSTSRVYVFVEKTSESSTAMTEKIATMHCTAQASSDSIYNQMAVILNGEGYAVTAGALKAAVSYSCPNAEINIVDFSCSWTDPQRAQRILEVFIQCVSTALYELPFDRQNIVLKVNSVPSLPVSNSSPSFSLWVLASALLGVVVGCIFAFIYEFGNRPVRNEEDLQSTLGIPVIGNVHKE